MVRLVPCPQEANNRQLHASCGYFPAKWPQKPWLEQTHQSRKVFQRNIEKGEKGSLKMNIIKKREIKEYFIIFHSTAK